MIRALVLALSLAGCGPTVLVLALSLAGCGPTVLWFGHTADRRVRVEVIEQGGLQYVVLDGKRRSAHRGIAGWSIAFSPRGHLVYAAQIGPDWVVVADGRPGERWRAIGALALSPEGRLAYAAERDGGWHVVVDGVRGPRHDAILRGTLQWSRDGRRVAYVGERAGRVQCVVDGVAGPSFDGVGGLAFSADGAHVAYTARDADGGRVVVDGVPGPRWTAVAQLILSDTGGHHAYAASDGSTWRVIADGTPGAAVDRIDRIVLRDDGAHVAWLARVAELDVLALDGLPIAAAPALREATVAFRPAAAPGSGPGLAYAAPVPGGGEQVIRDGVAGARFDEVGAPVWSSTGRLAYAARRGAVWSVVLDEREHAAGSSAGTPVFSPDGRRFAFAAQRGRHSYVISDRREHRFDLVFEDSLAFSSDGRRWSIVAGEVATEKLFFALEDGRRVPLSMKEISSAMARDPEAGNLLRAWSQAEADR